MFFVFVFIFGSVPPTLTFPHPIHENIKTTTLYYDNWIVPHQSVVCTPHLHPSNPPSPHLARLPWTPLKACQTCVQRREEMSQMSTDVERAPVQRPMFTQLLPPTKEVPEGTRVRLDCVLVGRPEPEVSDKITPDVCMHCVSALIYHGCAFLKATVKFIQENYAHPQ